MTVLVMVVAVLVLGLMPVLVVVLVVLVLVTMQALVAMLMAALMVLEVVLVLQLVVRLALVVVAAAGLQRRPHPTLRARHFLAKHRRRFAYPCSCTSCGTTLRS